MLIKSHSQELNRWREVKVQKPVRRRQSPLQTALNLDIRMYRINERQLRRGEKCPRIWKPTKMITASPLKAPEASKSTKQTVAKPFKAKASTTVIVKKTTEKKLTELFKVWSPVAEALRSQTGLEYSKGRRGDYRWGQYCCWLGWW